MERLEVIGDAAIEVIAAEGMRGLTHRAVDRAAGLPMGSTSYYARTRAALLELTMARIVALDQVSPRPGGLAESIAGFAFEAITSGRTRMLARYEFALEATRRPELRAVYDEGGLLIRRLAVEALTAAGSTAPQRHATRGGELAGGDDLRLTGRDGSPSRRRLSRRWSTALGSSSPASAWAEAWLSTSPP